MPGLLRSEYNPQYTTTPEKNVCNYYNVRYTLGLVMSVVAVTKNKKRLNKNKKTSTPISRKSGCFTFYNNTNICSLPYPAISLTLLQSTPINMQIGGLQGRSGGVCY